MILPYRRAITVKSPVQELLNIIGTAMPVYRHRTRQNNWIGINLKESCMARIIIVGDQPITTHGLMALIDSGFPGCDTVGACTAELPAILSGDMPFDLLVAVQGGHNEKTDIWRRSTVPVLHITCGTRAGEVEALFWAGARGVVDISNNACTVMAAIREVLKGHTFMEQSFKEQLLKGGKVPSANRTAYGLTKREREVAELMLDGKKMCEIGECLGLKASTVTTFKTKVFEKLGVDSLLALKEAYGHGAVASDMRDV
jgi:two-component system invasion response regulator UvrY